MYIIVFFVTLIISKFSIALLCSSVYEFYFFFYKIIDNFTLI